MADVTDPEMLSWLRDAIMGRLELARKAVHKGDGSWRVGCRCKGECRDYPGCRRVEGDDILVYDEGGHSTEQARHIAANDPQDTIARCEAELGILELCTPDASAEVALERGDISAEEYVTQDILGRRVVSVLAAGYKHHPGRKAEWAT